jgi:hypothetical protein
MQFISKTNPEGIRIVSEFLDNQWQDDASKYINIDYKKSAFPKSDLRLIIMAEQENLCCYCLKYMEDKDVTLEHIIPYSTNTQTQLESYFLVDVLKNNVVLQTDFTSSSIKLSTPPFPHRIAYQNLVASCNGNLVGSDDSKFCNGYRGDKFIHPFFYLDDINQRVKYNKLGQVYYTEDDDKNTYINSLNLNAKTLKNIRRTWYFLANSEFTLSEIEIAYSEQKRKDILFIAIGASSEKTRLDDSLVGTFLTDTFWNVLLQYKWFFNHYK